MRMQTARIKERANTDEREVERAVMQTEELVLARVMKKTEVPGCAFMPTTALAKAEARVWSSAVSHDKKLTNFV